MYQRLAPVVGGNFPVSNKTVNKDLLMTYLTPRFVSVLDTICRNTTFTTIFVHITLSLYIPCPTFTTIHSTINHQHYKLIPI